MIKHTIYVSDDIIVDYYTREVPSETLVCTANGVWPRMVEDGLIVMDGMGYYGKELYDRGYDVIAFKNKAYDYYTNLTFEDMKLITDTFNSLCTEYKRKVYFGGCASSWLALALSKYLKFDTAVLLMPRNELLPEDCDNLGIQLKIDIDSSIVWEGCHFILCCNFCHGWDYENLCRFTSAIKNKTVLNIPDDPEAHDIMLTLKRHKLWKQFFFNILVHNEIIENEHIIRM